MRVQSIMTRLLAIALGALVAACSAQAYEEQDSAVLEQPAESTLQDNSEQPDDLAGRAARIGDCGEVRLSIDTAWDPATADLIREATRWWEGAVGVDLGPLPLSDVPCDGTTACIARRDRPVQCPRTGIEIYVDVIKDHGGGYALLQRVVAHEVGHLLGVQHTESGVMSTHDGGTPWTALQPADIDGYESACVTRG